MSAPPPCAPPSNVDSTLFHQALSRFATGVTVATAALQDGRFAGVTINSFHAVSPDPPLVLWSLAHARGVPILAACAACSAYRPRSRHDEGDHAIVAGAVGRCHFHPHRALGFHRGRFIAIS